MYGLIVLSDSSTDMKKLIDCEKIFDETVAINNVEIKLINFIAHPSLN
jgi:hypothetical protein